MADAKSADNAELPDDEVARLRDEVIKRMLATPPQPRVAKPKPAKKAGR